MDNIASPIIDLSTQCFIKLDLQLTPDIRGHLSPKSKQNRVILLCRSLKQFDFETIFRDFWSTQAPFFFDIHR